MNKVQLSGRLTADPEIRVYNNEKGDIYVAKYTLAVPRRYKRDEADFFWCVSFGKTAQFIERYITKGTKIIAAGRMQQDKWTDRDTGKVRSVVTVIINEVEFAQSNPNHQSQNEEEKNRQSGAVSFGDGFVNIPDGLDEDLPFSDEDMIAEEIKNFLESANPDDIPIV
ncbi:MAG: single-stranded DNA-binding protein [Lachnospiraceae bacterium]|nr:single-stranded DNA-binding protein [Lachnospiraceae bacterium]